MAPRGGGGNSPATSKCDGASKGAGPDATIGFLVIFIVVHLCFSCGIYRRRATGISRGYGKARSQWGTITLSLLLALIANGLFLMMTIMQDCNLEVEGYSSITLVQSWTKDISVLALVGVIMASVFKQLHATTAAHLIYIAVLALLLVCKLSLQTALPEFETDHGTGKSLDNAISGLTVTYYAMLTLGTLMAATSMILTLIRASSITSSRSAKIWTFTLAASVVLMALLELIYQIHTVVRDNPYHPSTWATYIILANLFYTVTFVAILWLMSGSDTLFYHIGAISR